MQGNQRCSFHTRELLHSKCTLLHWDKRARTDEKNNRARSYENAVGTYLDYDDAPSGRRIIDGRKLAW